MIKKLVSHTKTINIARMFRDKEVSKRFIYCKRKKFSKYYLDKFSLKSAI